MDKVIFLIDNGHGTRKYTRGKCSPDRRIYEGEWNREFAAMLKERLDSVGVQSILLVPEEKDIPLKSRVERANTITSNMKAAGIDTVLISIHINAAASDDKYHNASGWTVWISGNASKKSRELSKIFADNAVEMGLTGNRAILPTGYWAASLYILKNTVCPAILCENMFMDNIGDEEFLLSEEGKKRLIDLYENSILEYMQIYDYKS